MTSFLVNQWTTPPILLAAGQMLAASFSSVHPIDPALALWMHKCKKLLWPPIIQTVNAVSLCCEPQQTHCALYPPVQETIIWCVCVVIGQHGNLRRL